MTTLTPPTKTTRKLDNWIDAYLSYTRNTEAPRQFHFWTAIATIAAVLERKVWIDMGAFQWVPNFFILLVGPAGIVTKSTTMRFGQNLVRKAQKGHIGPSSVTWQALLDVLKENSHEFLIGADGWRQSPVALWVSELGSFFDPQNREMVDLLVDLWDGAQGSFDRQTRADGKKDIVNAWVSMIACTTPTWLRDNFTAGLIGGGFASRMVFVYGDEKARLIAYPGLMEGGLDNELAESLVSDLRHFHEVLRGPMVLTSEAVAWGTEWYHKHHEQKSDTLASNRREGYNARKQTHMHKIAMVLSVSERDDRVITAEHLQRAQELLLQVEATMDKVLATVGNGAGGKDATDLLGHIGSKREMLKSELFDHMWQTMDSIHFDRALNDLVRAGKLQQIVAKGGDVKLIRTGK